MITGTIAIMALACVVTICVLSWFGTKVPPELNTLTGGLCGGLMTMLVKTTPTQAIQVSTPDSPAPVTVMNPASDPVPTTEQKIDKPFGL